MTSGIILYISSICRHIERERVTYIVVGYKKKGRRERKEALPMLYTTSSWRGPAYKDDDDEGS